MVEKRERLCVWKGEAASLINSTTNPDSQSGRSKDSRNAHAHACTYLSARPRPSISTLPDSPKNGKEDLPGRGVSPGVAWLGLVRGRM